MKKIGYISDSYGYWRYERLEDALVKCKYDKLQLLIHPVWWQKDSLSSSQRVERSIEGRMVFAKRKYYELDAKDTMKNSFSRYRNR